MDLSVGLPPYLLTIYQKAVLKKKKKAVLIRQVGMRS